MCTREMILLEVLWSENKNLCFSSIPGFNTRAFHPEMIFDDLLMSPDRPYGELLYTYNCIYSKNEGKWN
jgi:hypothetical protein